jgi:hypothetical protein
MNVLNRIARTLIRILANRYVVTILLIVLSIFIWKLQVKANDDGFIRGMVVDAKGNGVPRATVLLQERGLVIVESPISTRTDENGQFVYKDMSLVSFFIWAKKDGYLTPEKNPYHLYFKGQNFTLPEPIILGRD